MQFLKHCELIASRKQKTSNMVDKEFMFWNEFFKIMLKMNHSPHKKALL